jgi:amino acid transporter
MALTTVGALALALLFAALSRRLPADGGPYAYARVAFGNRLGFTNAWSYWITAWAGNAAIAVGWVLYVEHFINKGHNKLFSILLVLVGLWIPAVINLSGVKNMGSVQVVTTVVKFVALAFMATVGLFYIKSANFTPWNVSKESTIAAIGGGMAIALFSYLGVECAAVAAGKVRDPDRHVPRATILGATVFTTLVLMTGITSAIPYGFSALAQLKWRWIDHKATQTPRLARDLIVAALSLVFSILFIVYSRNTGHSFWVYWAPFFLAAGALLLGIPVYMSQRHRLTQPPAVPPYW